MMAKKGQMPSTPTVESDEFQTLLRYVTRLLRNSSEAEDVVQDAFLKLTQQELREPVRERRAWLYRAVRNQAFDFLRRRKTYQKVQDFLIYQKTKSDAPPTPAERLEQTETMEMLLAKLNELSPRHQEAVRLKFQEKLTYDEIASVMGESRSTIGWLLHEAILKLRQRMGTTENVGKGTIQ